jgi:dihydroorotase
MSHAVAKCFNIIERGYIREGYHADLVIADLNSPSPSELPILYKCGWSPFKGHHFPSRITHTFVNGHLVYDNGRWEEFQKGNRLQFDR